VELGDWLHSPVQAKTVAAGWLQHPLSIALTGGTILGLLSHHWKIGEDSASSQRRLEQ